MVLIGEDILDFTQFPGHEGVVGRAVGVISAEDVRGFGRAVFGNEPLLGKRVVRTLRVDDEEWVRVRGDETWTYPR